MSTSGFVRGRSAMAMVVATVVAVGSVLAGPVVALAAPAAAASCDPLDPFTETWVAAFAAAHPDVHMAAAVTDEATGCTFRSGSTESFPTASTAKAEIMGALFLSLQDRGITTLDGGTAALLSAMILVSDNDAAQVLFEQLGGAAALQAYGRRLGLQTTDNASWNWGGTATTPDDQVRLLHTLLVGGGALDDAWVARARSYMAGVTEDQRWGVSAGVPAGSTVWLKNGWLYNDGSYWGRTGWRINSIGVVQLPNGRRYSLAVFGNGYDLMSTGVGVAEDVSRQVATVLAAARNRPVLTLLASGAAALDAGAVFTAVTPTRLLDTRSSSGMVAAGGEVVVTVPTVDGVLPSAVALNVTATDAAAAGYVTVYADGTARPLASTLDQQPGRVVPDLAVVPVGTGGRVRLYTSQPTQLVVDLLGSWVPHPGAATAGRYRAVDPVRVLDTRSSGAVPAGGTVSVAVAGRGGVPATGAAAVVVNVTVTDVTVAGYVTVWPGGAARPVASTLNAAAGDTVANTTIVPVGADGTIGIFVQNGGQVVVDIVGWITDATVAAGTDGRFVALASPARVADTRFGDGDTDRVAGGGTATITTTPAGVPASATAVAVTVTYADPGADGFVTTYAAGTARPLASTTNPSVDVGTGANTTLSGVTTGRLTAYSLGSTELVVDVTGWFTP